MKNKFMNQIRREIEETFKRYGIKEYSIDLYTNEGHLYNHSFMSTALREHITLQHLSRVLGAQDGYIKGP